MNGSNPPSPKGRGAGHNPANRFEPTHHELELDQVEEDDEYLESLGRPRTEFLPDQSRSIITENDSPDVGFVASLNPYRGCEHGCIYCYARPTHEFLGYSAGLDFETKILVKHDAPELLRKELSSRRYQPRALGLSGVTDPYQPLERKLRADPALPGGAGRVPPGGHDHHQEPAGDAGYRPAGRTGPARRGGGVPVDHDAGPGADRPAGAEDDAAVGPARGDRRSWPTPASRSA